MAELSTLLRTVNTIIGTDVRFWGVLTSFYAATFFICLLISHPFSEDDGDDDEGDGFTFGRMARRSATSLALLLMAGETHHDQEAVIGLGGELSDGDDEAASGRAALWAVLYFLFIVFATTLLLNLLIAMMNNTYQQTTNESTLQYRVEFARRVLRYELLSPRGINTRCGQVRGAGHYAAPPARVLLRVPRSAPQPRECDARGRRHALRRPTERAGGRARRSAEQAAAVDDEERTP
jgi:hypothetical protein